MARHILNYCKIIHAFMIYIVACKVMLIESHARGPLISSNELN